MKSKEFIGFLEDLLELDIGKRTRDGLSTVLKVELRCVNTYGEKACSNGLSVNIERVKNILREEKNLQENSNMLEKVYESIVV